MRKTEESDPCVELAFQDIGCLQKRRIQPPHQSLVVDARSVGSGELYMKKSLIAAVILVVVSYILVNLPEWMYYDFGPRAKYHRLIKAIHDDDSGSVKQLVSQGTSLNTFPPGADPDWEDDNVAPLSEAIQQGNQPMVLLLLNLGADINKDSALDIAAEKGNANMINLLISHGAKVNDDADTCSALWTAAYLGNAGAVRCLLRHGAVPSVDTIEMAKQRHPSLVIILQNSRWPKRQRQGISR